MVSREHLGSKLTRYCNGGLADISVEMAFSGDAMCCASWFSRLNLFFFQMMISLASESPAEVERTENGRRHGWW